MNLPRLLLLVALLVASATLQAQRVQNQAFEVASIKPQSRLVAGGSWTGTRYYQAGTTLRSVIQFAYDLPRVRIDGGPNWLDAEFWEIEAKSPSPATVDEMRVMVKALLTERFKLRTRVETRELSVLDLRVASRDGKLGANATPPNCTPIGSRAIESLREAGEIPCGPSNTFGVTLDGTTSHLLQGVTMSQLARYLERFTGRIVRDRTGITDTFDIRLRYSIDVSQIPSARPPSMNTAPPLPTALEEQLGLKLESTKGAVDVLVIESVARPTPN
jgi:uncharacterized protein (TIGR03435 family)